MIPLVRNLRPGVDESHTLRGAVRLEIVPLVVDLPPARRHRAVGLQIVPGGLVVGIRQLQPAGLHGTVRLEIVPLAVHLLPARRHETVGLEIVIVVVDFLPAGHHITVGIDIVIAGRGVNPLRLDSRIGGIIHIIVLSLFLPPAGIGCRGEARSTEHHSQGCNSRFSAKAHIFIFLPLHSHDSLCFNP